jgi:hypothetical protein
MTHWYDQMDNAIDTRKSQYLSGSYGSGITGGKGTKEEKKLLIHTCFSSFLGEMDTGGAPGMNTI